MLTIQNLTITLSKNSRVLLSDFTFSLNFGDKAAIIGEEGDGKSTLLKTIIGENQDYVEHKGDIKISANIGYLPQEFPIKYQQLTVQNYLTQNCENVSSLAEMSKYLRLPSDFLRSEQKCETLSGGEKVKLQLAALLARQPDILLLDEPSNDLDIEALEWLERFIRDCPQAVMFISHDEKLLETAANVIIHIEQLRKKNLPRHTISRTSYTDYISRRSSAFIRAEQNAHKEKEIFDKKAERWRQIYQRVEHEQGSVSRQDPHSGRLLKKKMHSVKAQGRRLEREAESMAQLPDIEDAIFVKFPDSMAVPNGKTVLDFASDELRIGERLLSRDIKLQIFGAKKVGIIGKNGAGKSTLLKILAENLSQRRDIKAAYMPQNYTEKLEISQTPVDFLAKSSHGDDITKARNYLGSVKYTPDEMLAAVGELSGGQRAKLLFLKMVINGANVLLLDEPTRNFSPLSGPIIRAALKDFPGAIICVTHDRKYLSEVCDIVYKLTESGLIEVM